MLSNELLFISLTLIEIIMVFMSVRFGYEWLIGTIAINLILVGIFGSKLIYTFGFVTNVGNVFYACVFLATHFIIEKYGKKVAWKTIWFGIGSIAFFTLASQLAVHYKSIPLNDSVNDTITTLFSFSLRIIIASILSYTFSQYLNIRIFSWIREKTNGKSLWLRSTVANTVSQLLDSMLFFSIAFFDLPAPILLQAILVGWLLKSLVVLIGLPALYIDKYISKKYD